MQPTRKDDGEGGNPPALGHVADFQPHQIAAAQLTVDGEVEFRFYPARLELRTGLFPLQNGNLVLQTPDLLAVPLDRFPQPLDDFQQSP